MDSNDKDKLMKEQYKLAIEARDRLNDNYHKWMTFYYVANAAILVAITSIINKSNLDNSVLFLSIVGLLICVLWNLSCKGYYYWSNSWMDIIIKYENNLFKDNDDLRVYSVFSRKVAETKNSILIPNKPANISTPKLTLFFSYFAILCWFGYATYRFVFIQYTECCCLGFKIVILILFFMLILFIYSILLPLNAKSKDDNSHILI